MYYITCLLLRVIGEEVENDTDKIMSVTTYHPDSALVALDHPKSITFCRPSRTQSVSISMSTIQQALLKNIFSIVCSASYAKNKLSVEYCSARIA